MQILPKFILVWMLVFLHLTTPFWILLPLGRTIHVLFPLTWYWLVMLGIHILVLALIFHYVLGP